MINGESPMNLDGGLKCFGQSHDLGREYEQKKKGSRAKAPPQEQEAGREEKSPEARKIKGTTSASVGGRQ